MVDQSRFTSLGPCVHLAMHSDGSREYVTVDDVTIDATGWESATVQMVRDTKGHAVKVVVLERGTEIQTVTVERD